jgi:uncharacterized repeat protein (TIGR02543 family)
VSGSYDEVWLGALETQSWAHLAATFDYENNKVRAYFNGQLIAERDADLSGGIGGVTGQGRNKSTFLGSSPWNYTEEHGGFNGSGTDNRHYIDFLADDFVLVGCALTQAEIAAIMDDLGAKPLAYTARFNADGGEPSPADRPVFAGRLVPEPSAPEKAGYDFIGWYADGAQFAFDFENTPVAGDVSLKAKWEGDDDTGGDENGDDTGDDENNGDDTGDDAGKGEDEEDDGGAPIGGGTPSGSGTPSGGGSREGVTPNGGSASQTQQAPAASSADNPAAAAAASQFGDVGADAWYAEAVAFVSERALMLGTGDGRFSPDATATRAMLVTILARLSGENLSAYGSAGFADVNADAWYAEAVAWAQEHGIAAGVGENLFAPGAEITREQTALLFYRFARYRGAVATPAAAGTAFADSASISDWAVEAVSWATENGVVTGKPGNAFDPKGLATRAEIATMLQRFAEKAL